MSTDRVSFDALRAVHYQERDPGTRWQKDDWVSIDLDTPLDNRKILTPNVVRLPAGGYRMYYTGLGFGPGNSCERSEGTILSAVSADGARWRKESGIRVDVHPPHATLRVLCPDVVPRPEGGWRMYFEAREPDQPSHVLSAVSADGLRWEPEPGVRFGDGRWSYGSPRCIYIEPPPGGDPTARWCRLYCHHYSWPMRSGLDAQNHIVSAISPDGLQFTPEPGVRIAQESELENYAVYAPEVLRLGTGGYRMYYGGWSDAPLRGRIFSARSDDGLCWVKDPEPCLEFGGRWDALKVSEPCGIDLDDGRHRMYYEASDADANWRILSATSAPRANPAKSA
ncbi:hypothetical protein HQ590_05755 [bacterium]|nr:hypothetical protein [bacterium]